MEGAYAETLVWCTGVLVVKNMVNHLLVVRVRLGLKDFNGKVSPEALDQVTSTVLYYGLGAFGGPLLSANDLDRLNCMEVNASQNETYFLLMAMVWPYASAGAPAWAPWALQAYVYSRMIHFVLYTLVKVQPWRAFAWSASILILLIMAINVLFAGGSTLEL
jgi:hypothetical protein